MELHWYYPKGTEQTPAHAQETNMKRQTKLVGITSACIDCLALGAIEGEKRLHLEVADITRKLAQSQKRRLPTLHREPQKWETTIPVLKVNRKVNEIKDLSSPPPRQC